MTKAQLIEKRGLEWYENHKRNMRERSRQRFQEDQEYREKVLEQKRQNHIKHNEKRREYNRKRAVICRINCRDRNRLIAKGLIPEGKIVHQKSLAFTKLEEAVMWANAAIARNE